MTDKTSTTTEPAAPKPDETFAWTGETTNGSPAGETTSTGREWLSQLQAMIENIAEQAGPVLREVSAKAAELAALAGEKAGPVATRAAELTAEAGAKLAERSRDLATDLRRERAPKGADSTGATASQEPAETVAKD